MCGTSGRCGHRPLRAICRTLCRAGPACPAESKSYRAAGHIGPALRIILRPLRCRASPTGGRRGGRPCPPEQREALSFRASDRVTGVGIRSPRPLSPDHLAAVRPDGDDVVPVCHVNGALEALLHRQGMGGLREVSVVDDHGVEPVAHGEAVARAEILVPRRGAQIVPLLHGEEVRMPLIRDPPRLGGADGHGDDLVHGQLRATGDVAAQRDPQPLVDHLPHGTQA